MSASALLISCEHGGNAVPPELTPLFAGSESLLASHRGYDLGAAATARALARATGAPVLIARTTRLVVDLNRSLRHPGLFSTLTKGLPPDQRRRLLAAHYHPHREAVAGAVAALLAQGRDVLHLACHSFTPCLDGVVRRCDVGFLYDPGRAAEKAFCLAWMEALAGQDGRLVLRRNFPYRGVADGLVTSLRRRFGQAYAGMELEVNQRFALDGEASLDGLNRLLAASLKHVLAGARTTAVPPA